MAGAATRPRSGPANVTGWVTSSAASRAARDRSSNDAVSAGARISRMMTSLPRFGSISRRISAKSVGSTSGTDGLEAYACRLGDRPVVRRRRQDRRHALPSQGKRDTQVGKDVPVRSPARQNDPHSLDYWFRLRDYRAGETKAKLECRTVPLSSTSGRSGPRLERSRCSCAKAEAAPFLARSSARTTRATRR